MMKRWMLCAAMLLMAGCAHPAPSYDPPIFRSVAVAMPTAYVACLKKEAVKYDTEYQLGLACRVDLEDGVPSGLGYLQRASTIRGIDDDAKPLREELVAQSASERLAAKKSAREKEDAATKEETRRWAECAVAVISKNKDEVPVLDAVRIAKLACGHLWKGTRDADDALYYRIVVAPRTEPAAVSTKRGERPDIRM